MNQNIKIFINFFKSIFFKFDFYNIFCSLEHNILKQKVTTQSIVLIK